MRDFVSEMRAFIATETRDGGYVARVKAAEIVSYLEEHDRELLDGYLHQIAEQTIYREISDRDRSARAYSRATATRSVFRSAAVAAGQGDEGPIARFLDNRYVLEDGSRFRLAEMRAEQLAYVAHTYEARASHNRLSAMFLRALESQVGNGTVGDTFDESRLARLWRSVTTRHPGSESHATTQGVPQQPAA